jgi:nitrite reductase/ring-hydroxylating ferredoxin subunit
MVAVRTEGYTRVASTDEVPPGVTRKVVVEGKDVLLANVDGAYYAIGNVCTHEEGPLDEGIMHGIRDRMSLARLTFRCQNWPGHAGSC